MDASKSSFLHSRRFWGVVLSAELIISLYSFSSLLTDFDTPFGLLTVTLSIIGGTTFGVIADIISTNNKVLEYLAIILSLVFFVVMLHKTFHDSQVKIVYPFLLSINWLISFVLLWLFLSSL